MRTGDELGPPVVSAGWLAARLQVAPDDDLVIADARWYLDGRSGRNAYESGHLPGAVFVDLAVVLADPPSAERGRHPMPDPARFAAALGAIGIGPDAIVVAYDDAGVPGGGGTGAARLVWMLRRIGQRASLLDGGIGAWTGAVEQAETTRAARDRETVAWPAGLVVGADVAAGAPVVLDARSAERYRGEVEPIDPRAGHIPGARSMPFDENLDDDGRFRSAAELRTALTAAGVTAGGPPPVVYCGSGVTACHVLLAVEQAGLGVGRLYAGSWSQWSNHPARPAATGADPG